jgi:chromosomal replication initiator protein
VAVEAILEARDHGPGPVLFVGPCGSGKTHLATGLVAAYRARFRRRPAVYVPAVDFSREMADAIDTQAMDDFRQRYRQASLLAIDDVDRLAGKEAAQRELASTLDAVPRPAAKWFSRPRSLRGNWPASCPNCKPV